jgi:hypothetical protein
VEALEREEVVVEADLVPERLQFAEAGEQVGPTPVRRCVEDEVRRAQPALVFAAGELERTLQA